MCGGASLPASLTASSLFLLKMESWSEEEPTEIASSSLVMATSLNEARASWVSGVVTGWTAVGSLTSKGFVECWYVPHGSTRLAQLLT